MADILPPAPIDAPFASYNWNDWYQKVRTAINNTGSVDWSIIVNTPTTLAGYGITDAVVKNAAIVGATKTKITYDTKGLVTAGTDLSASDIPNLDWSKITTGKPTTFSGYGISDTSAGLRGALSDETGTGLAVFNDTPTLLTPKVDTLIMDKATLKGIKVDTTTPTYPWHDMLGSIEVRGTGANDPNFAVFRNGIRAYQFGLNDEVWVMFHLLHDYVPGTDIYLHSHWAHSSASVTTGSVTWSYEITYAKGHDQAAFAATKTTSVTQNASTTQYQHMIAETAISSAGGSATLLDNSLFEVDGIIMVRCYLSANSMSAATDPFLFLLDCHYQSTGIGTKQKAPNFYT